MAIGKGLFPAVAAQDVFLYATGMSAIAAVQTALIDYLGPEKCICFG
jgi:hypothetical protein